MTSSDVDGLHAERDGLVLENDVISDVTLTFMHSATALPTWDTVLEAGSGKYFATAGWLSSTAGGHRELNSAAFARIADSTLSLARTGLLDGQNVSDSRQISLGENFDLSKTLFLTIFTCTSRSFNCRSATLSGPTG